jgi:DEAD/DEAH box helicase domain-containing protein
MRGVIGDVLVRSQVSKFKKLKFNTHENIGYGEIQLPEEEMHTRALVLLFDQNSQPGILLNNMDSQEITSVLVRLSHLLKQVAPAFLLCDSNDIGVSERLRDPHFSQPSIYLYDQYPGGSGLAEAFARSAREIFSAARELLQDCSCDEGCPSCLGPRDPDEEIVGNPKPWTLNVLNSVLKEPSE